MAAGAVVDTSNNGPLGQQSRYANTYTPSLLHAIPRAPARAAAGFEGAAFAGEDLWTAYEFSWLNAHGKPQVAGLRLRVSCQSDAFVESKSMKLYLGSFAQTRFDTQAELMGTLDKDLSLAFRAPVLLELLELQQLATTVPQMPGKCLDDLDVRISQYERDPSLLATEDDTEVVVHESLNTHLFRSLCPVTGQPDWASIAIDYKGAPIRHENLLRYLVSYRNHEAFHESTIEQIHTDITRRCAPTALSVYGRFQRRGGIDINPFRSSHESTAPVYRLPRQ